MKTQIFPPPGASAPGSNFKIPSTALIIGGIIIAATVIYFVIIKPKKDGKEKIYSAGE